MPQISDFHACCLSRAYISFAAAFSAAFFLMDLSTCSFISFFIVPNPEGMAAAMAAGAYINTLDLFGSGITGDVH